MNRTGLAPDAPQAPRWVVYLLLLGLYLTVRGYHSREGDQAYRLPLLLHRQDPALFQSDPFVRAFDAFNPHRGALAVLDLASRPLGLSTALFTLYVLTFGATCLGLDRLARAVWPELGPGVGLVAVGLIFTARAGNIGTNHLFEPLLLDRLMAFGLGWLALAEAIGRPGRGHWTAPGLLGLAAVIHPSVALQLGLVLAGGWVIASGGRRDRLLPAALGLLVLALAPGVGGNLGQGGRLTRGLPPDEFRLLSVELQGPQHMLPHLWRQPQWLAWGCYLVLAVQALAGSARRRDARPWPDGRTRLAIALGVILAGLLAGLVAVEGWRSLRITLFQPFRMATVARGLALVLASGRLLDLWRGGRTVDRCRAALLASGLVGDGALVVATLVDLGIAGVEALPARVVPEHARARLVWAAGTLALGGGLLFLSRHDTESGHVPLALGVLAALLRSGGERIGFPTWNRRRLAWAVGLAWAVPVAALLAPGLGFPGSDATGWRRALIARCRFGEIPVDDIERLAVWCREHTPAEARFIGPPGPKTFRLWSLRSLAFNRAGSPYHAEGLADWFARFRDHVAHPGPASAFVRAYQADRHGLERRYDQQPASSLAALAVRQSATHIVAPPPRPGDPTGPLEWLHTEGRYAVYRVRSPEIASFSPLNDPGGGEE